MIEDLLKLKKISPEQYELWMLFQANELGRKTLDRMMLAYFMEEPTRDEFGEAGFAFYSGRCSVLRDIHRAITYVQKQIRELENDYGKQQPEQ
jgi:hypothetical protein